MKRPNDVHLFGSLRRRGVSPRMLRLEGPVPVIELVQRLGLPVESVQLAMVNFRSVGPSFPVSPGDRVALFPPEYPIFADWRDHRFGAARRAPENPSKAASRKEVP